MKKEKKARGTHAEFPLEDSLALTGTVSGADCTGMIPFGTVDSAEEFERTDKLHPYSKGRSRE